MVLKFSGSGSRFLNMGIGFLKKLLQEAKVSKDVITLEATVVTGFEFCALEECREKLRPLSSNKSKGRIFFNIKKDSFPNVLKMRMIDNVFLVTESFEELKLKKIKEEDLLTIQNLVEEVDWGKAIPQWAEIVEFKGVQFPKCALKDPNEPLHENEPACQNCLKVMKTGDERISVQNEVGGGSSVQNGDTNKVPDEQVFQVPPDQGSACEVPGPTKYISSDGDGNGSAEVQNDSALEMSPGVQMFDAKETEETDDELAFHSAEEDLPAEEPVGGLCAAVEPLDQGSCQEQELFSKMTDSSALQSSIGTDITANGTLKEPAVREDMEPKQAKYEKQKSKQARRREERKKRSSKLAKLETDDAAKLGESDEPNPACVSCDSDKAESNDATSLTGSESAERSVDKPKDVQRKNYWQKRKENKAKKEAERKAKKPPRKAYIDDGIMKFRVTCYRNGPKHSFDSNDAAGHFGGLLNDKFHWTVDLTRYDINVVLVIEEDSAYVTLALTNESLHRRNIKHFGPTTLRATLCYGLMRLAEPCTGDIVMDPMCGGGSIPIEGALAFPKTYHICGDVNAKCVAQTGNNIAHNSQERPLLVDALQWSVRRLPLQDSVIDVFITDLPFGLRVGKQKDNTGLYIAALTEVARVVRTCGRAALLTYDKTAMIRALQRTMHLWREIRVNMVNQGGLRCYAYLLLRKARVPPSNPAVPAQAPAQEPPQVEDPAIREPGEHSGKPSDPSELLKELNLEDEETPIPIPTEPPTSEPGSGENCSDDTKRA